MGGRHWTSHRGPPPLSFCFAGCLSDILRPALVSTQVHQPRLFIWDLFHKAMLLSEGRLLYYGRASQARQDLTSLHDSVARTHLCGCMPG